MPKKILVIFTITVIILVSVTAIIIINSINKKPNIGEIKLSFPEGKQNIINSCAFDYVKNEWDSHAFLNYINIPDCSLLSRLNITNFRNKFAYSMFNSQNNTNEKPIFNPKSFSQGIYMMMKNNRNLKIINKTRGKIYTNVGDWLLIWANYDFSVDNYPNEYKAKVLKDGSLVRDYQDFDIIEENGKVIIYKLFEVCHTGTQKILNRIYDSDKTSFSIIEVVVEPQK